MWLGAQTITNVNPSISIIGGEPFYKHKVLEGQTIEAIAEAYYTTPKDIAAVNPGIITGIKAGMKLKVPYTDESLAAMSGQPAAAPKPKEAVVVKRTDVQPSTQPQSQPPPPKQTAPRPKPKSSQVTPLQEAVTLLEEEEPETEPAEIPVEPQEETQEPEPAPEETPVKPQEEIQEPEPKEEPVEEAETEDPVEEAETAPVSEIDTTTSTTTTKQEAVAEPEIEEVNAAPGAEEVEDEPEVAEEAPAESAADEPELIMDLNQLSEDVQESLESLKKIREVLESPADQAVQDEPEPVDPKTARFMSDFLDEQFTQFFDSNATDSMFHLREYFFANIDQYGRIGGLKDERTETNKNTRMLNMSELNGVVLDVYEVPNGEDDRVALGIEVDVMRYEYDLKVKRKKVRLYESTMYVEHLAADHPHTRLILDKASEMGERGRCKVVLLDGKKSVSMHRPFEYNPFGNKAKSLLERPVLRIEQMDFK